ncbi:endolytic transglycosylase MltG [Blastococcus sp. TF02A-26]|uniref:endolytic transglycosylase MltG n=1 Tax=Blastococcus sp. TF02A-26 TaxID=2250577 RepID=UPI000DE96EE7|nr:endolytic transglycosylase MltG [Blastococcus sp. TF02A-26]RBY88305.1 endolytic transglycosylase MltG [Blastococcus sp. TF02A-26]
MTFPTPPGGRGQDGGSAPAGQSLSAWAAGLPRQQAPVRPAPAEWAPPPPAPARRRAGVIDRLDAPDFPLADYARASADGADDDRTGRMPGIGDGPPPPPLPESTTPGAPLPPRPRSTWSRMQRRTDAGRHASPDEEPTVAHPAVPPAGGDVRAATAHDDDTEGHPLLDEQTGGLDVIVTDDRARRSRRSRRAEHHDEHADEHADDSADDSADDHDHPADDHGDSARPRRRRRPVAVVLSLVVLAALVAGIVFGGKALIDLVNPADEDYTGQGTGSVQIRIAEGDTLSDIGSTLVEADVIASVGPFVDAAETRPAATGIQPGVYGMRQQMSGAAALDLLLDPATRLFSRVTIPEGFTVQRVLTRLSEETDTPIEELTAVAADPVAVGLPPYANGLLEGWLFPATYDFEPETTPQQVLQMMVARSVQTLDELGVPEADRLRVVTEASLVQAEAASPEDMAMVAQVLDNRLAIGMKLQLDTTVNYASGKSGITTTAEDRANPSPYNTYYSAGLPPGAITNPGEEALRAVLNPTPGEWLYFVVVNPDTGETRFAVTDAEHAANVALFQQWLRENPS